jgi:NADP-dependent 3-hydroxy acid dehydrogenase YdfG
LKDGSFLPNDRLHKTNYTPEPEAIARAMAFAIEQPDDVDVGDIVVRPTVQG